MRRRNRVVRKQTWVCLALLCGSERFSTLLTLARRHAEGVDPLVRSDAALPILNPPPRDVSLLSR